MKPLLLPAALIAALAPMPLFAQVPAKFVVSPDLPSAPGEPAATPSNLTTTGLDNSQQNSNASPDTPDGGPQQTKRILGILPNFRSVSAGTILPPQTVKEKFQTGLADSFDYSSFVFAGIQAGIAQGTDSYPAFHQGAAGFGRYFWHTFADQADENLLVESILPSVLHQDSRYYTLGHGGFLKRSQYAVTRILITRTDSGTPTANISEILGAGGAAAISSAYYPGQYCTWTKTGQRWLTNVILDGAQLYVKEFWPDINHTLLHGKD